MNHHWRARIHLSHYKQFWGRWWTVLSSGCQTQQIFWHTQRNAVSTFYGNCITCISENMEGRFKSLLIMPAFLNLVSLLDTLLWPSDGENLVTLRESQIIELTEHFNDNDILLSNLCNVYQVQNEYNRLKNLTRYIWENNFKTTYLNMEKNLNQYHYHKRLQKHIACIWNCACDTIYKCKSRMTFLHINRIKIDWSGNV